MSTKPGEGHFTHEEEERFTLLPGDLLVCEGGDIGRTALWQGEIQKCYHQNHLHRMRVNNENVVPEFYLYWLWAGFQLGFDLPSSSRKVGKIPIVSSAGISGFHDVAKVAGPGVITGRYGSIGKVHFIEQDFWPLNTTLYVKDFKCNDPKFVFYLLQTIDIQSFNDKTSVPGENRNHLHAIKLAYHSLEQQKKIAGFLTGIDLKLESEGKRKKVLYSLFHSVLHSLMTGRVRIHTTGFMLD